MWDTVASDTEGSEKSVSEYQSPKVGTVPEAQIPLIVNFGRSYAQSVPVIA